MGLFPWIERYENPNYQNGINVQLTEYIFIEIFIGRFTMMDYYRYRNLLIDCINEYNQCTLFHAVFTDSGD